MISRYKLKREINRIQLQISCALHFVTDKIKAWFYDRNWKNLIQLSDGSNQSNSNKYAIFVIYQKISIAASIFETCNDLLRKNYKVLIISNASINSSNIFQLRKYVWRICIRPNFGYDFGAYRDGIRLLVEWKISPDRLIIMNDSIWFSLNSDKEDISNMELLAHDVVCLQEYIPLNRLGQPRINKKKYYGSFFYMFQNCVLKEKKFIHFWINYQLTNNKYRTIKNGEIKLSQTFEELNFSCIGLFSNQIFINHLSNFKNHDLLIILNDLVVEESSLALRIASFQSNFDSLNADEYKLKIIQLIVECVYRTNILTTASLPLLRFFNLNYLKKTNEIMTSKLLSKIQQAIKSNAISIDNKFIIDEILNRGSR